MGKRNTVNLPAVGRTACGSRVGLREAYLLSTLSNLSSSRSHLKLIENLIVYYFYIIYVFLIKKYRVW